MNNNFSHLVSTLEKLYITKFPALLSLHDLVTLLLITLAIALNIPKIWLNLWYSLNIFDLAEFAVCTKDLDF